jgi:hypothetical protein
MTCRGWCCSLTTLLTLWTWSLHERPLDVKPLDSFPEFHGTRGFNTEFTRALHLFLSWARPIQTTSPHSTYPRSILILSTQLHLGLPSGLFPLAFPTIRFSLLPPCPDKIEGDCYFKFSTKWVEICPHTKPLHRLSKRYYCASVYRPWNKYHGSTNCNLLGRRCLLHPNLPTSTIGECFKRLVVPVMPRVRSFNQLFDTTH